jgi:hypothetical protein
MNYDTLNYHTASHLSAPDSSYDPHSIDATFDNSRCQHHSPAGRRCRLPISNPASGLCYTHSRPLEKQAEAENLAAQLIGQLTTFESAYDINQVLSKLFILLAQDRVSSRRAAVLAYIGNLLLRTLPAIDRELANDDEAPTIVFDSPDSLSQ